MHNTTISLKKIITMCSATLILWGCGNSDNSSTKPSLIINEAESFDDLPNCSPKREGDTAKVINDTAVYICQNGRWSVKDFMTYESEDDLPNCTANREGKQALLTETGDKKICSNNQWISLKEYNDTDGNIDKKNDISSSSEDSNSSAAYSSSSLANSYSSCSLAEESSSSSADESSSDSTKITNLCGETEYNADSSFCDTRDFHIYKFVTIGTQTWMTENLNYYNSENAVVDGHSGCQEDIPENCNNTGRWYEWRAALGKLATECGSASTSCNYLNEQKVRGVCPIGWHLPKKEEWETLFSTIGGQDSAGWKLKSKAGWEGTRLSSDSSSIESYDGSGIDAYGFTAKPTEFKEKKTWMMSTASSWTTTSTTTSFWTASVHVNGGGCIGGSDGIPQTCSNPSQGGDHVCLTSDESNITSERCGKNTYIRCVKD